MFGTALLGGCGLLAVGDPSTESRISNDTAMAVTVTLGLDSSRCGLENPESGEVEEWLRRFAVGEGVSIVAMDIGRLTGTYQLAAQGFMVVHSSLGSSPYFYFNRVVLWKDSEERTLAGFAEIARMFQSVRAYDYELKVSDAF